MFLQSNFKIQSSFVCKGISPKGIVGLSITSLVIIVYFFKRDLDQKKLKSQIESFNKNITQSEKLKAQEAFTKKSAGACFGELSTMTLDSDFKSVLSKFGREIRKDEFDKLQNFIIPLLKHKTFETSNALEIKAICANVLNRIKNKKTSQHPVLKPILEMIFNQTNAKKSKKQILNQTNVKKSQKQI